MSQHGTQGTKQFSALAPSVTQNRHGVDLAKLNEGEFYPVSIDGGRTVARLLEKNLSEDAFRIEYESGHEFSEVTVDGDTFRPEIAEVRNPITDEEFAALSEGDRVGVYLRGYETTVGCWVQSIDTDSQEIEIWGQFSAQTISRTVSRKLVWSPAE